MSSVTLRISEIKQPRGGYIKLSDFETITFDDGAILNEEENVNASIIGSAVDYLTRYMTGANIEDAFYIPLIGADRAEQFGIKKITKVAEKLMNDIYGLDDESIINACKLTSFDLWYRNPFAATAASSYKEINPDPATIQNIQILVERCMGFFDEYGPVVADGFTFEPPVEDLKAQAKMFRKGVGTYGGYTPTVDSGDGDFLTADTMWDIKVLRNKPQSKHTLQLLMYWIMGQHSGQEIYKNITGIGFFNPRLYTMYLLDMNNVPDEVLEAVERDVICYPENEIWW